MGCVRVSTCMLHLWHIQSGIHCRGRRSHFVSFLRDERSGLKPLDLSGSCHRTKAATILFERRDGAPHRTTIRRPIYRLSRSLIAAAEMPRAVTDIRLLHRTKPTSATAALGQRLPRPWALETFNPCPQYLSFRACWRSAAACLLSATSGCEQPQQSTLYSITSSARKRNDSGIVRPSAFAVVRFTTRSNRVGCSTGMSPGFAPRRILST